MKPEIKKLLILNLPYLLFVWLFDKVGAAVRLSPGADASAKLLHLGDGFTAAFSSIAPSFHPADLALGIAGAVIVRLIIYTKGKNAKKYRRGTEYGSARWGGADDIKPYTDPVFENNIPLTQTERLTMNSRPKQPKYARNKNILVIGGSGSGKTRFFVKPSLMQCTSKDFPTSYIVTDPKGTLILETGKMLQRYKYRIKVLNTINFKKSMKYNPFAYLRSEKDILKLVNTIIANTKGDGEKSGEDFWVKAEKLYYTALIGYIWYEAPENEKNFTTVINENGKKHKYMRNTPKSVWTAKLRCSCGAGFIQFKWGVNRDGAVVHGFQCYRRTRRPSISYLQEHGLDLGISCQIKAISEWKLDLMASKVFQNLTFDKGKTVKEVYRILNRCMAEEKTVRISKKAMLENSIAKQKERLGRYIDLCADGVITKQELVDRRKGLDARIAELQSQYESIEQEDERSGSIDMKLISQKLDEWQKAAKTDVSRKLINSCVAQITPVSNEEFRWVLDFQLSEVKGINMTSCTMDGFMELARFVIPFEDAKAFKASRNQKIHRRDWNNLTVVVGIRSKICP